MLEKKIDLYIKILLFVFLLFAALIIARYVLSRQSLKESQEKIAALQKLFTQAEQPTLDKPILKTTDPRIGTASAKNTVIVFSDFQCPHCADLAQTLSQFLAKYRDKILLIWKDFPNPVFPQAKSAAVAARCAQLEDKFWEYHDFLYANQESLGKTVYQEIAKQLGLNIDAFNQCLENQETLPLVEDDFQEGQALKIDGTPYLFINGQRVSGAVTLEELEKIIKGEAS